MERLQYLRKHMGTYCTLDRLSQQGEGISLMERPISLQNKEKCINWVRLGLSDMVASCCISAAASSHCFRRASCSSQATCSFSSKSSNSFISFMSWAIKSPACFHNNHFYFWRQRSFANAISSSSSKEFCALMRCFHSALEKDGSDIIQHTPPDWIHLLQWSKGGNLKHGL